jgi:polyhydroxyalkanoate synthesis repressor PhaR
MTAPNESPPPAEVPAATPDEAPRPRRVIKRYSNRKLYDTVSSKYVTLEEIAQMVKAGEELSIIDNRSKDDLTAVTLAQIIYEEEKRKSRMPLGMLRQLISSSGEAIQEFFDRSVMTPVAEMRDTANRQVTEIRQSALHLRDAATHRVTELTGTARRVFARGEADIEHKVDETMRGFEAALEDLRQRLDLQTKTGEAEGWRVADQLILRLQKRIEDLELMIQALRKAPRDDSDPGDEPPPADPQ